MIHVKGVDTHCVVTTRRARMSILRAPAPNATQIVHVSTQYNLLEHLGKNPTHISILDLLKASHPSITRGLCS